MTMSPIFTIGYEGATLSSFIRALRANGVTVLADVRELPLSRRKGFSKTALSEALAAEGVRYVHLRALGDPKPGRIAAREGRYADFRLIFEDHLQSQDAQDALAQLRALALSDSVCIMCFERDPEHCHRSILTQRLGKAFFKRRIDLYVDASAGSPPQRRISARSYSRQSAAAAE